MYCSCSQYTSSGSGGRSAESFAGVTPSRPEPAVWKYERARLRPAVLFTSSMHFFAAASELNVTNANPVHSYARSISDSSAFSCSANFSFDASRLAWHFPILRSTWRSFRS